MTANEFHALLNDDSKVITGDIFWAEDDDHSPAVEFRANIESQAGYPIFVVGSVNRLARTLTFAVIHRAVGRIYGLDLGKDHHNVSCRMVGEKHKHTWDERLRDKEAYVADDISADVSDPLTVWAQFCIEAKIVHRGVMQPIPIVELEAE